MESSSARREEVRETAASWPHSLQCLTSYAALTAGASLSSNNFSKFVKEFGLMRGVQSAGGKIDTVFQRVVSDRAMKSDNKKTAEIKHTGTHSTRRSMAFDDFLVGLCGLARAKDFNRELEGVEDEAIVKEIIVTMVEQRAA